MEKTLEELYGLKANPVSLKRVATKRGKWLEVFKNPSISSTGVLRKYIVEIGFPEFTCLCPKTSHPDFATITIRYVPNEDCVELKSLKYYLNSFRNEGHFHEQVTNDIYTDLQEALAPLELQVIGKFNVRGGTYPVIKVGKDF